MLRYRTFRNTDPPILVSIWRSLGTQRYLAPNVSLDEFERFVFSRLYFDPAGLFIAYDGDEPAGFAHAGFGAAKQEFAISTELGVTCLIVLRPDCNNSDVAPGLLEQCEKYLTGKGAKVLYGGAIQPLNPFYLGMYGGSELPGVMETDTLACKTFDSSGYERVKSTLVFRGDLRSVESPVNRAQLQIRRRMSVQMKNDLSTSNWWEACTLGNFDLTRFDLMPKTGGESFSHVTVRTMMTPGESGPVRTVGLIELETQKSHRRQGLVSFLLTEAFHTLLRNGINTAEVQTMADNVAAVSLYKKLGFEQIDSGTVFRKEPKA